MTPLRGVKQGKPMKRSKKQFTGERRKYIRHACAPEMKAIVDFNIDVARRSPGRLPPMAFRRGEKGTIRNISDRGISIELDGFLPEGMTIKMAIDNPVTSPIETGGRVVWSKKVAEHRERYVMGMTFRYMRDRHRRNLDKLIDFLRTIPE